MKNKNKSLPKVWYLIILDAIILIACAANVYIMKLLTKSSVFCIFILLETWPIVSLIIGAKTINKSIHLIAILLINIILYLLTGYIFAHYLFS